MLKPQILASQPQPVEGTPAGVSGGEEGVEADAPIAWSESLRRAIRTPQELASLLSIPPERLGGGDGNRRFPLLVTREFAARMRPGDLDDPLLRQVLPQGEELESAAGFSLDAVGDHAAQIAEGLYQKYHARVLLISTGACAIHCRYCFRQHFPYHDQPRGLAQWAGALERIATDPSIQEVILSGGDPLMLVDSTLAELVNRLDRMPHLRRLRIHTRLPVVLPTRVDQRLLKWLSSTRLSRIVVLHINHAQEIDGAVASACQRLRQAGAVLLNQAVLLRGVNDTVDALEQLSLRLLDIDVLPYYLHQLDRVSGTQHFEVPLEAGRAVVAELARRLPGYAVPRWVWEEPGARHKQPLGGW